jgi:hypothetical protein
MNTSLLNDPQFNKYYEKHGKYLKLNDTSSPRAANGSFSVTKGGLVVI